MLLLQHLALLFRSCLSLPLAHSLAFGWLEAVSALAVNWLAVKERYCLTRIRSSKSASSLAIVDEMTMYLNSKIYWLVPLQILILIQLLNQVLIGLLLRLLVHKLPFLPSI